MSALCIKLAKFRGDYLAVCPSYLEFRAERLWLAAAFGRPAIARQKTCAPTVGNDADENVSDTTP